jgi:hypothetical protein
MLLAILFLAIGGAGIAVENAIKEEAEIRKVERKTDRSKIK